MTHDKQLDRQTFVAQTAISRSQKIQVFLARNAAHIEQANFAIAGAEFFEERRVAPRRMK